MGRQHFCLFVFLLFSLASQANDCSPTHTEETTLSRSEVKMVHSIAEAQRNYDTISSDIRRLKNRLYWSENEHSFFSQNIKIPNAFTQNVIRKIEAALTNNYADFVYYADLGHFHILISLEESTNSKNLQSALESPQTKFLFHTAELFQFREGDFLSGSFTQDPWMQWRYYSRNFVAVNDSSDNLTVLFAPPPAIYNTVRNLPGFQEVGTLYFSTNKNGCFQFQHKDQQLKLDMTLNP